MCSDSYTIPILSLFFLYHPYIPYFLIQRIFYFLVNVSGGVSTWAKCEGHIYHRCPMLKYLPFIMYCEVCCCLQKKKANWLQTFEHMAAH